MSVLKMLESKSWGVECQLESNTCVGQLRASDWRWAEPVPRLLTQIIKKYNCSKMFGWNVKLFKFFRNAKKAAFGKVPNYNMCTWHLIGAGWKKICVLSRRSPPRRILTVDYRPKWRCGCHRVRCDNQFSSSINTRKPANLTSSSSSDAARH